ncbi:MAG TPA: DEAD/DEAH box helicase, partial [Kofleriaceae bacterium]|nr:DEAD/DEAH box helicase [Kofleriaceae bacterium]
GLFQTTSAGCPIEPASLGDPVTRLVTIERLLAACARDPELAEPALAPLLEREREVLRRGRAVSPRELDRLLRGLRRKLFPYQREGVARFLATGRLLLADDMGLGKTAQAIASCHALFAAGEIRRALIVVPAPLKAQWEREWRAFTDLPIRAVDGHPDERARIYGRTDRGALLVNYEQLLRDLPLVQAYGPELAILDEAQRIKNWETKTAALVKQIEAPWRLVLTGTPMENRLDELASIMEWVDEHALEPRWRLASWHATRADGRREVVGARNLETLRARLAPSMLRRVRRDVLAQLPPRRDIRVPAPLTPAQQAAHDELSPAIAQIVARAKQRALTQAEFLKLMRLLTQQRMICNALALVEFGDLWPTLERARRRTPTLLAALGSPKLLELRERIADLAATQRRKVVVFSQWRRMLKLAAWVCGDVLARAGARAVFFTGEESQRRRAENIVAFHDDPDARVLFATDAGGVGLNLQRAASCCINLELPWNPAVLEQRIGRIYRLGQDQPVEIYNLVAASGIEDRIAGLVGDKRALFAGLFDGATDEVPFDSAGTFLTRVHEVLKAPAGAPSSPDPSEALDAADPADAIDVTDTINAEAGDPVGATGAAADLPSAAGAGSGAIAAPQPELPLPLPPPAAGAALASVAGEHAIGLRSELQPPSPELAPPPGDADEDTRPGLDLAELTAGLRHLTIRSLADGRVSLELPRPAASALGGLLRALAAAVEGTAPDA